MSRKVLMTGAAGTIGSYLVTHLTSRYDFVLSDRRRPADTRGYPFVEADLIDLEAMRALCRDIDTVLHLAADPRMEAPWESLLPNNIIAVYNIFQAAHEAGCRRVIFASSINVVFGYPADRQVHTNMPVRPPNLYGASKAWGEAVARFYADQKGLSALCLRLGWVVDRDDPEIRWDHPLIDMTLTLPDLARLMAASLDAPDDLRFGIFHGVSDNRWKRLDITDTREILGYQPEDDGFALAELRQTE